MAVHGKLCHTSNMMVHTRNVMTCTQQTVIHTCIVMTCKQRIMIHTCIVITCKQCIKIHTLYNASTSGEGMESSTIKSLSLDNAIASRADML